MVRRNEKSGFTLVEVLISTAVLTIGMGIVVSLTVQTMVYSHEEQMQSGRRGPARVSGNRQKGEEPGLETPRV
jgi:prepilin-type N-terminal cleavage/methylation domain-containing protein